VPFETPTERQEHFDKHRYEFDNPPSTEQEYEQKADNFMSKPLTWTMVEGQHVLGGRVRLDMLTREFGCTKLNGFVVTYFIANPAIHGKNSNLEYFRDYCV